MRARNREINIFNMSLLDILTGMLGAFLFLMLGLLPYYAKVSKNKDIDPQEVQALRNQVAQQQQEIADLKKQIEELQKLIKESGGGPLTAEQVQNLMDELNQLREQLRQAQNQIQQLQEQNNAFQGQLAQAQQKQQEAEKQRDYWHAQNGTINIITTWDSIATDIDVFVIDPDGTIRGPKVKEKLLGKDTVYEGSDSHGSNYSSNHEGVMTFIASDTKDSDYLVVYRVPKNASPADYANLRGWFLYQEAFGEGKGLSLMENSLGDSHASYAQPGGIYAWAGLHFDSKKQTVSPRPPDGFKLPPGVTIPRFHPPSPPTPVFPFPNRKPTATPSPHQ